MRETHTVFRAGAAPARPGTQGTRAGYPELDRFRLVAALLVVAIHTSPLLSLGETADFLLTRVAARVAVPFFLMTSGFFLLPGLPAHGGFTNRQRQALGRFFRRTALLWGAALLLYLPLNLYGGKLSANAPGEPLRYFLLEGGFYHLWYLPAALLGMALCLALLRLGRTAALGAAGALYLVGVFGDSWWGVAAKLPPLRSFYDGLLGFFGETRNGLFFAPLFLLLGGWLAGRRWPGRRAAAAGLALALGCMTAEALALHQLGLQRRDTMYLLLPPVMVFLFSLLARRRGAGRPGLRRLSTLVYLLHPLVIVAVRGLARPLGLWWLLVDCSPVHYLAVAVGSLLLAAALLFVRDKLPPPPGGEKRDRPGFCKGEELPPHVAPGPPVQEARRLWAEIDLSAVRENAAALQALLPEGCRLMAVVKADAYGHGDLEICRALAPAGVDAFAVATADEAVRLRRQGVEGELLVLGATPACRAGELAALDIAQTAADAAHARALSAAAAEAGTTLRVHLAVDTGMHRLGVDAADPAAVEELLRLPHLRAAGIYTHLCVPESEEPEDLAFTKRQIARFYRLLEALRRDGLAPPPAHLLSSEGILRWQGLPCAFARAGLALYGVPSAPGERMPAGVALRPALALRTRVALVRQIAPGESAGYGRAFTAARPTRLAVLPAGYADGVPRSLSCGRGQVLIGGRPAPVAGRICMDQMTVDVTDLPPVAPGDIATLIGADGGGQLAAQEVAAAAGTIPNELLSRLGSRVERVYLS